MQFGSHPNDNKKVGLLQRPRPAGPKGGATAIHYCVCRNPHSPVCKEVHTLLTMTSLLAPHSPVFIGVSWTGVWKCNCTGVWVSVARPRGPAIAAPVGETVLSYPGKRVHRSHSRRWARRHRVLLIAVGFTSLLLVAAVSLRLGSLYPSPAGQTNSALLSRSLAALAGPVLPASLQSPARRTVYPYSIVPGGVRSANELREAAAHDPVVAQHYSGFDYRRATVVELKEAKLVYLSYRLRNKVYWTKKKIALHKGEKLITDGKVTARSRCANQVSESAQKSVSAEEPLASKFDEPIADGGPSTQIPYPGEFESSLFGQGPAGEGVADPPETTSMLSGPSFGGGYPGFSPPAVPTTSCAPDTKHHDDEFSAHTTKKKDPCGSNPPPATVPEPGTILLVSSGVAGIYARYRSKRVLG
jgi:hypothetical protein